MNKGRFFRREYKRAAIRKVIEKGPFFSDVAGDQAIALRRPSEVLIVRSDRGSPFASSAYRSRLD